jgi:hypothetical protein
MLLEKLIPRVVMITSNLENTAAQITIGSNSKTGTRYLEQLPWRVSTENNVKLLVRVTGNRLHDVDAKVFGFWLA